MAEHLLICDGAPPEGLQLPAAVEIWSHADFAATVRGPGILRHLLRYRSVTLVLAHLGLRPRPLLVMSVLRLLGHGRVVMVDLHQRQLHVGPLALLRQAFATLGEWLRLPGLLAEVSRELADLLLRAQRSSAVAPQPGAPCLYLKTDLWFSTQVGGSVTHMAGVVNNLADATGAAPLVFATADNPIVDSRITVRSLLPAAAFWDFRELPALLFSRSASAEVSAAVGGERPSFIYQRYSLNNYAGVKLSLELNVPLVTEYNGSEVWISQNWGTPVARPELSEQVERLNLEAADLIVVVSDVLRQDLIGRGISDERILVNPNGVDATAFDPHLDASDLRRSLGLECKTVIGFIGTFGPWHGTEELVEAFALLLAKQPQHCENLRLLLVGQGSRRAAALDAANRLGVLSQCVFTGQVPQKDAPLYLACCDFLAAPHVPNPDGTPFFGSPTKLFEYMAMGRPIVASALGQIQEILQHGRSAWLVEPGHAAALAEGLAHVLEQPDLGRSLGERAREEVLEKHTWRHHTRRIVDALERVCS
ncbi:glycosyltransferase [Pseudomonas fuscovaginae UPB0736]|uniref:glycosyltransferase n=1 Tax=Pseudomonas asplenii TaxID=53407 RepID=UPI00031DAB04|nr:glycosyltransferase [Pseudomonas fuscovaginae]UUQ63730.1 glycosyltransferase [Pseudomonas fuscovaginae UPB0736]